MGRNWAIVIGINQYDNLQPLNYAKRDAAAMRDYFLNEAGFEQVYYFADDAPSIEQDHGPPFQPLPTFAKLDRFLDVRFDKPFLYSGDNFWFFFAGHGKRHRERDYLMPSDVNPRKIEGTAISIHYVTERLQRCGADNIILMLDACRTEGDRDGEGIGVEQQKGVVTLFACSPSERSYEIDELQQGAFTYALLDGLRLQGEANCATVERLDQHLRYQVPTLNRKYNRPRQTPYTNAEPIAKRHLILLPQRATLADVMVLKNDALEAEAERDWELAEQLWVRVLAVSAADRQAIRAIKRIARQSDSDLSPQRESVPVTPDRSIQLTSVVPPLPLPSRSTLKIPTFQFEVITVDAQGQEVSRRPGEAQSRVEELGNGVQLEMVAIPGGTFQMGSPDTEEGRSNNESPQHPVRIKPFFMGKHPITQTQWRVVAALPKVNQALDPDPSDFKGDHRPIEQVSWHEAVEFCARLSRKTGHECRLPSEAEWEYACRAGTTTSFHFGETITTDLANYRGADWEYQGKTVSGCYGAGPKGEYRGKTTEGGRFPPNAFGLYDMHGNIFEWCLDHWHNNYQGAPTDGSAWIEGGDSDKRVRRGGSWFNDPARCRSAGRSRNDPGFQFFNTGFRVVCSVSRTL